MALHIQADRIRQRHPPDQRRTALVNAALQVIARDGVSAATVRAIAAEAGVTPGLIRHYFDSKNALIIAAYDQHMHQLNEASSLDLAGSSAAARLAHFVRQTLTPPVTHPRALRLWAGFMQFLDTDPALEEVHARRYHQYRQKLEGLIGATLDEAGQAVTGTERTSLAAACNALLDGLWIEGSAQPGAMNNRALSDLALRSITKLLGVAPGTLEAAR